MKHFKHMSGGGSITMQLISRIVLICIVTFVSVGVGCNSDLVQPYATTVTVVFVRSDGGKFDSLYQSIHYEIDRPTDPPGGDKGQWVKVGDSVVTNIQVDKTTDVTYFNLTIRPFYTDVSGYPRAPIVVTPSVVRPDKHIYRYEFFDTDSIISTTR